jgi:hypothetical protein
MTVTVDGNVTNTASTDNLLVYGTTTPIYQLYNPNERIQVHAVTLTQGKTFRVPKTRRPVFLAHENGTDIVIASWTKLDTPSTVRTDTPALHAYFLKTPSYHLGITLDAATLTFLLDMGLDVDRPDVDGNTLLHLACVHQHVDLVEILLATGRCTLGMRNADGHTPLWYAVFDPTETHGDTMYLREDMTIARLLVAQGATLGDQQREVVWSALLLAGPAVQTHVGTLIRDAVVTPRLGQVRDTLHTELPHAVIDMIDAYVRTSWTTNVDYLIHGIAGPLQPQRQPLLLQPPDETLHPPIELVEFYKALHAGSTPAVPPTCTLPAAEADPLVCTLQQHQAAAAAYRHYDLRVTFWWEDGSGRLQEPTIENYQGPLHASIVPVSPTCYVFRTEDSLFVLNVGPGPISLHRTTDRAFVEMVLPNQVVRVPMLRHPVLLSNTSALHPTETTLVPVLATIEPWEYARDGWDPLPATYTSIDWDPESDDDPKYFFPHTCLLIHRDIDITWVVKYDHLAFVDRAGFDMGQTDSDGRTLLHLVCLATPDKKHTNQLNYLLAARHCDVNARDHQRETALWHILMPLLTQPQSHISVDLLTCVTALLQAGAMFGSHLDTKVRVTCLDLDTTVQDLLCYIVARADGVNQRPWEATLGRLIDGPMYRPH